MRLVGVICTLAVMAGAYFFFVKPALDTTSDAVNKFSEPFNGINEQIDRAQDQAEAAQQQALQQGQPGGANGVNLSKLQQCMSKASATRNTAAVQKCARKYGAR
jgi:hypothetical protein